MTQPLTTDWLLYRKCPICQRATGSPCRVANTGIVNGQPNGIPGDLQQPHKGRRMRNIPRAGTIQV